MKRSTVLLSAAGGAQYSTQHSTVQLMYGGAAGWMAAGRRGGGAAGGLAGCGAADWGLVAVELAAGCLWTCSRPVLGARGALASGTRRTRSAGRLDHITDILTPPPPGITLGAKAAAANAAGLDRMGQRNAVVAMCWLSMVLFAVLLMGE